MSTTGFAGVRRSNRVTPRTSEVEASSEISSRTAETPYANVSHPVRGLDACELDADGRLAAPSIGRGHAEIIDTSYGR